MSPVIPCIHVPRLSMLSVRPGSCQSSGGYSLVNRSCIPAFSTRGKGALGPLLSAPVGASKRETPTSNLTESTALYACLSSHTHFMCGSTPKKFKSAIGVESTDYFKQSLAKWWVYFVFYFSDLCSFHSHDLLRLLGSKISHHFKLNAPKMYIFNSKQNTLYLWAEKQDPKHL